MTRLMAFFVSLSFFAAISLAPASAGDGSDAESLVDQPVQGSKGKVEWIFVGCAAYPAETAAAQDPDVTAVTSVSPVDVAERLTPLQNGAGLVED